MYIYVILWRRKSDICEQWIDEDSFKTEQEAITHAQLQSTQMEYEDAEFNVFMTILG